MQLEGERYTHSVKYVLNILKVYNGFEFTDCMQENQLVDVLESGRSSVSAVLYDCSLG
jgi:hypothetical protein